MIRGNFKIKKIEAREPSDNKRFEDLIAKYGVGSHMVFRSEDEDDELFVDEL